MVIGRVTEKVDIQDLFCLKERRVIVRWICVKKRHNVSSTLVLTVWQVVTENLRPRGIQSLQDKKTAAIRVIYSILFSFLFLIMDHCKKCVFYKHTIKVCIITVQLFLCDDLHTMCL